MRSTQNFAQSSSCFVHLLSPSHEEDFFQNLCASHKVRTLQGSVPKGIFDGFENVFVFHKNETSEVGF